MRLTCRILLVTIALLVPALAAAGSPLRETVAGLRALRVEDLETEVPVAARPLLTDLKQGLRSVIVGTITGKAQQDWEPADLQAAVREILERQGLPIEEDAVPRYGSLARVTVERPDGAPDLLVATVTIGIQCGHDTSLYVFQRGAKGWALRHAQEAGPYTSINEAQSHLGYLVLPAQRKGGFHLVTVDVPSWCTSFWRTIHYRVMSFEPGRQPGKLLLERNGSIYIGEETIYNLKAAPEGFSLSWWGHTALEVSLIRAYVARYRLGERRANRIPPLAMSAQSFLDEWLALPWAQAEQWSDPSARPVLRTWHGRLRAALQHPCSMSLTFVQACPSPGDRWQIGIMPAQADCPIRLPPELYGTVVRRGEGFMLQEIGSARRPDCPGESEPADEIETQGRTLP